MTKVILVAKYTSPEGVVIPPSIPVDKTDENASGWSLVRHNGSMAWVPTNWLKPVPEQQAQDLPPPPTTTETPNTTAPPQESPEHNQTFTNLDSDDDDDDEDSEDGDGISTFFVRALFDFHAEDEDELEFLKDDVIRVVSGQTGKEWWTGTLDGRIGVFPATYVERLDHGGARASQSDISAPSMPERQQMRPRLRTVSSTNGSRGTGIKLLNMDDAQEETDVDRLRPTVRPKPTATSPPQQQQEQQQQAVVAASDDALSFPPPPSDTDNVADPAVEIAPSVTADLPLPPPPEMVDDDPLPPPPGMDNIPTDPDISTLPPPPADTDMTMPPPPPADVDAAMPVLDNLPPPPLTDDQTASSSDLDLPPPPPSVVSSTDPIFPPPQSSPVASMAFPPPPPPTTIATTTTTTTSTASTATATTTTAQASIVAPPPTMTSHPATLAATQAVSNPLPTIVHTTPKLAPPVHQKPIVASSHSPQFAAELAKTIGGPPAGPPPTRPMRHSLVPTSPSSTTPSSAPLSQPDGSLGSIQLPPPPALSPQAPLDRPTIAPPPPPETQAPADLATAPRRSAPPPPSAGGRRNTLKPKMRKQKSTESATTPTSLSEALKNKEGGFARLGVSGPTISGATAQDASLRRSWSVSLAKGRRNTLESRRLLANDKTARLTNDLLGLRPQLKHWRDSAGQESSLVLQHSGQLMKISKGKAQCRWFFLFDKVLVYCKREKNKLELKGTLEMRDVSINNMPNGSVEHGGSTVNHAWQIDNVKKNKWYTLFASCEEEKKAWLEAFEKEKAFTQSFDKNVFKVTITRSAKIGFGFDIQEMYVGGVCQCSIATVNHEELCHGLRKGDVFIQLNGIDVRGVPMKDVIKMLYLTKPKHTVDCAVYRDPQPNNSNNS